MGCVLGMNKAYLAIGLLILLFAGLVSAQAQPYDPFGRIWKAILELKQKVAQLFEITGNLQMQISDTNADLQGFKSQTSTTINELQAMDTNLQNQINDANNDLQGFKEQTNQTITELHATDTNLQNQINTTNSNLQNLQQQINGIPIQSRDDFYLRSTSAPAYPGYESFYASCDDANDIPIFGSCSIDASPGVNNGFRTGYNIPEYWYDYTQPARWVCPTGGNDNQAFIACIRQ